MSAPAKVRAAATVILLRPAEAKGFEVFFTRRPDTMPFLGGMYCYPGGSITKGDSSQSSLERAVGVTPIQARKIIGAHFSPRAALAFWLAAVRELFEECGILLATESLGADVSPKLPTLHRALLDRSLSFAGLLEQENLRCDLGRLSYFSHWQTPSQIPLRFDTRFFIAALPPEQTPLPSSYEVTHSLWLAPEQAMQLHERGDLPMSFPTFASLRTLADFDALENVLHEYRTGAKN
jgi:8-oxo-dGTP pyrophosphatase MutT (NUDIX family)